MEDERKDYYKYLSRLSKHEILFSDVGDHIASQFFTLDNRNETTDFEICTLNGITVGIEHDFLSKALRELQERKREILLMYYFMDMSSSEIAELLELNRSTVYKHRTGGLDYIKKFMEEE